MKNFLLIPNLDPPSFSLNPFPLVLSLSARKKSRSSYFCESCLSIEKATGQGLAAPKGRGGCETQTCIPPSRGGLLCHLLQDVSPNHFSQWVGGICVSPRQVSGGVCALRCFVTGCWRAQGVCREGPGERRACVCGAMREESHEWCLLIRIGNIV